jgi:hypothetical protein
LYDRTGIIIIRPVERKPQTRLRNKKEDQRNPFLFYGDQFEIGLLPFADIGKKGFTDKADQ